MASESFQMSQDNQEIDQAQVIMEKKNGVWTPQTFGTSFPEWETQVPQLFN